MSDFAPSTTTLDEVLDFLLTQPSPEQIIAFHASDSAQERVRYLLEANRNNSLSESEKEELDRTVLLDDVFSLLKIKAMEKIAEKS